MTKSIYVDSSALVAVLFDEPKSNRYRSILHKNRQNVLSSALLEAEVYSAAKREGIPLETAAGFIDLVALVFPDRSLQSEYLTVFQNGHLRGADAHHLATALYVDPQAKNLSFVTADRKQAETAQTIGFQVVQY